MRTNLVGSDRQTLIRYSFGCCCVELLFNWTGYTKLYLTVAHTCTDMPCVSQNNQLYKPLLRSAWKCYNLIAVIRYTLSNVRCMYSMFAVIPVVLVNRQFDKFVTDAVKNSARIRVLLLLLFEPFCVNNCYLRSTSNCWPNEASSQF